MSKREGKKILKDAKVAGKQYATDQINSDYFMDWVHDQLVEASRMDPSEVLPLETKSDARKIARNMLQQLVWDTKRDLPGRDILELSGASGVFDAGSEDWVRDKYGIEPRDVEDSFFEGFDGYLNDDSVRDWLAEELLTINQELRGDVRESENRDPQAPYTIEDVNTLTGSRSHRRATKYETYDDAHAQAVVKAKRTRSFVHYNILDNRERIVATLRGESAEEVPPGSLGESSRKEGDVLIEFGVVRLEGKMGWVPGVWEVVGESPPRLLTNLVAPGYDRDDAAAAAREIAQEEARHYVGDWNVSVVEIREMTQAEASERARKYTRRHRAREANGHRVVRDFNTLEDLIQHAAVELGATHVAGDGAHTKLYFPRGGSYPYEEAKVWKQGGYWHSERRRVGVEALPSDARPIGRASGRRAAETFGVAEQHTARWHWVEGDDEIVCFVGSHADALRYYKRNGGSRAGLRLISARRTEGPRPVVGQRWG